MDRRWIEREGEEVMALCMKGREDKVRSCDCLSVLVEMKHGGELEGWGLSEKESRTSKGKGW
jgi:hypothetical protein